MPAFKVWCRVMLSTACPKVKPGQLTRAEQKLKDRADEARSLAECYRIVDARDAFRCRVCGRRCSPVAIPTLERGERHHLIFKSRGGKHHSKNVLLICKARCHDEIHLQGTLHLSGNADTRNPDTGKLCGVKVERLTEAGWKVEKFC